MRNLKLTISYNGHNFFGWQKQEGKRTVQAVIEEAIFLLTQERVCVEASGRTDKGVHALGQVASVKIENKMPLSNFKRALNNLLPEDILVKSVQNAPEDFHARFSAKKKTYRYYVQIGGERNAIKSATQTHFPYVIDFEKVKQACKIFVGKHNFRGFCSANTQVTNFEREIFDFCVKKHGKMLTFSITGDGFLYNMVRILVGTCLDYGRGKLSLRDLEEALSKGKRNLAGQTMPPNGLFLVNVKYN